MKTNCVDEVTLPRRTVLKSGLLLGCGLLVPPALSRAAPAAAKVSQAVAKYQNQPKGDQTCSVCAHFIPASNTCKLVEGSINPGGWCTLWARKA